MTREEAIARIKDHMEHHGIGKYPHIKLKEALEMALSALTPPTQEQMERVWKGCPHCTQTNARQNLGYQYCERCGRPLTPEAWKEQGKRWEALTNVKTD